MEHDMMVADGTADIETGQLLIIKRYVLWSSLFTIVSISAFSTTVLSFIHSYVINHNQSTHSPQSQ